MSNPVVIYDPVLEMAAIIDLDRRVAFGPAMIGPDSGSLLEGWLVSIPYDLSTVPQDTLLDWFTRYADAVSGEGFPGPTTPNPMPVVTPPNGGMVDDAGAVREAVAAGDGPPVVQPSDADMEGHESEADQVARQAATVGPDAPPPGTHPVTGACFACNGTGKVPGLNPGETISCNLCGGTGQLTVDVPN